jgi:hypothetical protein
MRRLATLVMIVLAAWISAGPIVEALEQCREVCPQDQASGECPDDGTCCSCCVHVRAMVAPAPPPLFSGIASAPAFEPRAGLPVAAEPHDILHVPKAS